MTKKQCPLGEDCDLTIAWMMGAEDARDRAKARIAALEAKLAKAVEGLRDAVDAWDNHNKTGDMMQGHWVTDARATLAEIEGDKP